MTPVSSAAPAPAADGLAKKMRVDAKDKRRPIGRIARWVKRLNGKYASFPGVAVFDTSDFPWVAAIERDWRLIRAELDTVMERQAKLPAFHEVVAQLKTISRDRQWKTYFLLGYGKAVKRNIESCLQTWRILKTIPGLKTAMFSILEPGKHLPAYKGPYNGVLRLHLGLIVPEPGEAITLRVADRICHWEEGKVLIFDDYLEHEVWNNSGGNRVVLFVDFVKPLRFPANVVNWLVLKLVPLTPFARELEERHAAWERQVYRDRNPPA